MGIGDASRGSWWRSFWLCLLLLCAPFANASAAPLVLQFLAGDAEPAEVLSGALDARLGAPLQGGIKRQEHPVGWWRITVPGGLAAEGEPRLLLEQPFLNRVDAWVPGREAPTRHALYGAHADPGHSARALVIELPHGIPEGEAVWLRVHTGSLMAMHPTIDNAAQVRADDLAYVAWRMFVLTVLAVLSLLAFAFCAGTGETSFAWFGAMLGFATLYLVAIGGDARLVPGADAMFSSTRANAIIAGLGVLCSNMFQRDYLDLRRKLPWLDRLLRGGSALVALGCLGCALGDWRGFWHLVNGGLVLSAIFLLVGSTVLALRRDRAGRVVMASWLPLMVFISLTATGTGMLGLWDSPRWLPQALAGSFALASLLLSIGLADKLLELRRDRDHASARAHADELTGLLNRAGIESELARVVQAAQRGGQAMSIAFIDLDHFKPINDAHGHGVGDQCLRIVSQRIRNQLRGDDVIGRYGGDEFLVVLPATAAGEALGIARRMLDSVRQRPLTIGELRLDAGLSIGVAERLHGEPIESLVERADAALYSSKQAGRSRVTVARTEPAPGQDAVPIINRRDGGVTWG